MPEGSVEATFSPEAFTLKFWYEGQLIEWTKSRTYEIVGGRYE